MMNRGFKNDQDIRKRQIDTLKIFNDNVTEIVENEEYAVGFMSGGRQIKINVYLGAAFPNEKPNLVVSPLINHPWVHGPSGHVQNAPGLLNFTVHSDLGRVVQAIIREFERFPPSYYTNDQIVSGSSTEVQPLAPTSNTPMVDITIPELANLSIEQLHQLNSDSQYLDDFVEELKTVQLFNDELEGLMTEVEEIANENMAKEQDLLTIKEKLTKRWNEFRSLGEKYDFLNNQYQKKSEEFAPQHIKELLQIAASVADSECESQVEQFLTGKIDVQTFLTTYMAAKRLSAMRKAKEERLSQQLNAFEKATF